MAKLHSCEPKRYGLKNLRACEIWSAVFPGLDDELVARLAYSFEYDYEANEERSAVKLHGSLDDVRVELRGLLRHWAEVHKPNLCCYERGPDWLRIHDRREGAWMRTSAESTVTLRGRHAEIYEFLGQTRFPRQVAEHFNLEVCDVLRFIEYLASRRLVHYDGNKALALATFASIDDLGAGAILRDAPPIEPQDPLPSDLTWSDGQPVAMERMC